MTEPTMPELLGCPFCGKAPVIRRTVEEYTDPTGEFTAGYSIDCDDCGISVTEEYREHAVARWSRRALPADPPAAWIEAMMKAAQFLADRLDEFEVDRDDAPRNFYGHVEPALARLKAALHAAMGRRGC